MSEEIPQWLAEVRQLKQKESIKFAGHQFDEEGWHDEDACRVCLEGKTVINSCKCGQCCRSLLIEVALEDGEREPKIKERARPILDAPDESGHREQIGYFLNDPAGGGCLFLDRETSLCTIYETRPLLCKLFDCDGEDRDNLVQLGILPPR